MRVAHHFVLRGGLIVPGLLSLGAAVEVLDPPEARAELIAVATQLAALSCARA
ncbi:hypothetical protein [Streptomyces qaidamensis]|uniref:hypothetical protein n=1 Tax=Streptomyces qaidamensis TaxID=1783515 RepID=UPI000A5FB630|nr:hypothetical protein [Streptomyces qaidamensis]